MLRPTSRGAAALVALLTAALVGCTGLPPAQPPDPSFRLPPQTLGRTLAWQQRLEVTMQGTRQPVLDALLEADSTSLRLALLGAGQTLARLEWDGRRLQIERGRGWPREIAPERVLSDLQFALWPLPALATGLPADTTVTDEGSLRVLRQGGERVATVQGAGTRHIEIVNHRRGYTLRIDSVALGDGTP